MPKISVIIPVYNVEKYLRQCLDSVINQTYKDIEIICVNDASIDSSAEILKEYEDKIIIVNNEINLGLGLTRNHGMKYATGEYIHFLDSDDWLELDAYEKLSQNILNSPDVVYFLWNNIDIRNNKKIPQKQIDFNIYDKVQIIEKTGINAWHGIFKRNFLFENSLIFNDYPCMEDIEFTYKVLMSTEKIEFINEQLLNYRINNPNSLIGKFYKYYYCAINSYNTIYEYSKILPFEKREKILSILLNSVMYRVLGGFVMNELDYNGLKNFAASIDLGVFQKNIHEYKWYGMYNDILNSNKFMIKLKYKLKQVLKDDFYSIYEILKGLKA